MNQFQQQVSKIRSGVSDAAEYAGAYNSLKKLLLSPNTKYEKVSQSLTSEFLSTLVHSYAENVNKEFVYLLMVTAVFVNRRKPDEHFFGAPNFPLVCTRALSLSMEQTKKNLENFELRYSIHFVRVLVDNLHLKQARKVCNSLFGVAIWNVLEYKTHLLDKHSLKDKFQKMVENKDADKQVLSSWLSTLLTNLCRKLLDLSVNTDPKGLLKVLFGLLIDILCQLPTRQFVNTLLAETSFIAIVSSCKFHQNEVSDEHSDYTKTWNTLVSYIYFPIDDFSGKESTAAAFDAFAEFKAFCFSQFPEKCDILLGSSISQLSQFQQFCKAFEEFSKDDLASLCQKAQIQVVPSLTLECIYHKIIDPIVYQNAIFLHFASFPSYSDLADSQKIYGNEDSFFCKDILNPGIQFLTVEDFLYRASTLLKVKMSAQVNKEMSAVINRVKPKGKPAARSKYGARVNKTEVLNTVSISNSKPYPSSVLVKFKCENDGLQLSVNDIVLSVCSTEFQGVGENAATDSGVIRAGTVESVDCEKNVFVVLLESNGRESECNYYDKVDFLFRPGDKSQRGLKTLKTVRAIVNRGAFLNNNFESAILGFGRLKDSDLEHQTIDLGSLFSKRSDLMKALDNVQSIEFSDSLGTRKSKKQKTDDMNKAKLTLTNSSTVKVDLYEDKKRYFNQTEKHRSSRPDFDEAQKKAILRSLKNDCTVILGAPGTGKSDILTEVVAKLYKNSSENRTLVLVSSQNKMIYERLLQKSYIDCDRVFDLTMGKLAGVKAIEEYLFELLAKVGKLAESLSVEGSFSNSVADSNSLVEIVENVWKDWKKNPKQEFPFKQFCLDTGLKYSNTEQFQNDVHDSLVELFANIANCKPLETLKRLETKVQFLFSRYCKVVIVDVETFAVEFKDFISDMTPNFENVVIDDSDRMSSLHPLTGIICNKNLQKIVLTGDSVESQNDSFLNLFHSRAPQALLNKQFRTHKRFSELYARKYTGSELELVNADTSEDSGINLVAISGTEKELQMGIYQNLEEAEKSVELAIQLIEKYGSKRDVTILTTSIGQKLLITEIVSKKCGFPVNVSLVEEYGGRESDIVVISTVRTAVDNSLCGQIVRGISRAKDEVYIVSDTKMLQKLGKTEESIERLLQLCGS